MIGVLIATHGDMAKGMYDAIDMICGKPESVDYISLQRGQDSEAFGKELSNKIEELDTGDGVIVLADLMGATPMNQSSLLLFNNEKLNVITGVNLPMVAVAVMERDCVNNLQELIDKVIEDGKESICNVRTLLNI